MTHSLGNVLSYSMEGGRRAALCARRVSLPAELSWLTRLPAPAEACQPCVHQVWHALCHSPWLVVTVNSYLQVHGMT